MDINVLLPPPSTEELEAAKHEAAKRASKLYVAACVIYTFCIVASVSAFASLSISRGSEPVEAVLRSLIIPGIALALWFILRKKLKFVRVLSGLSATCVGFALAYAIILTVAKHIPGVNPTIGGIVFGTIASAFINISIKHIVDKVLDRHEYAVVEALGYEPIVEKDQHSRLAAHTYRATDPTVATYFDEVEKTRAITHIEHKALDLFHREGIKTKVGAEGALLLQPSVASGLNELLSEIKSVKPVTNLSVEVNRIFFRKEGATLLRAAVTSKMRAAGLNIMADRFADEFGDRTSIFQALRIAAKYVKVTSPKIVGFDRIKELGPSRAA